MRQPRTVLVFPFRLTVDGPRYAIFQRADDDNWQSVSGGVEDDAVLVRQHHRRRLLPYVHSEEVLRHDVEPGRPVRAGGEAGPFDTADHV